MSLISTTGFSTADTNVWPPFAIVMLIFVSLVCGCAGSTSGGMKVDRVLLSGKLLVAKIRRQQHPNAIVRIRVDGVSQEDELLHSVILFIVVYLALILGGTIVGTAFGQDLMTAFSSSVSCMGNVGPGFGNVGVASNFSDVPTILKLKDTILMLMGRLEIFGFIQLFFIKSWR